MRAHSIVLLSLFVSIIAGCGAKSSNSGEMSGKVEDGVQSKLFQTWEMEPTYDEKNERKPPRWLLILERGRATAVVNCKTPEGEKLSARASTNVNYLKDEIEFLQELKPLTTKDDFKCSWEIPKGKFNYRLVDWSDRLFIKFFGYETSLFKYANSRVMSDPSSNM